MEYVGNIVYDDLLKHEGMELVIFGAGKSGRKIYDFLQRNGKAGNVSFFCDRNEALWGKKVEGVEIIDPMQAVTSEIEYHFLVSGLYADEMIKFLQKNDVRKIHLLFI